MRLIILTHPPATIFLFFFEYFDYLEYTCVSSITHYCDCFDNEYFFVAFPSLLPSNSSLSNFVSDASKSPVPVTSELFLHFYIRHWVVVSPVKGIFNKKGVTIPQLLATI